MKLAIVILSCLIIGSSAAELFIYFELKQETNNCLEPWKDSGMEVRYTEQAGCQVKLPSGYWIPAQNYRN